MRDIIVMGASSGGMEAICKVLEGLPGGLPASVFIVQHVGPHSILAQIFARCSSLPTVAPADGDTIGRGRIYVAPSDYHLLLDDGKVRLSKAPRENRHRPSVDALFRSAARNFRSRVIAVVLSGALDDGAAGAFAVKTRGGLVVVQEDALVPEMPQAVMQTVDVDYAVPLGEVASLLVRLVKEKGGIKKPRKRAGKQKQGNGEPAAPEACAAPFVCPECSGPLFETRLGKLSQYHCLVDHRFSPESLSEAHREALERTLLAAIRMLHERVTVHQSLAQRTIFGDQHLRERFDEVAESASQDAALLREILERL